ncbi:MAG: hypothetical protein Kow0077_15270 [Anaerolineae bacterium]
MVSTYAAQSEPEDQPVVMHFCANCGHQMLRAADLLPDLCPACHDLTTWLQHPPRHVQRQNALRDRRNRAG